MTRSRLLSHAERFDVTNPQLCPALTWKGQFTSSGEEDPTVPSTHSHQYWCVYTQTCIGPDGDIAEPQPCSDETRSCHRFAVRDHS
jgi:hypothetical protein